MFDNHQPGFVCCLTTLAPGEECGVMHLGQFLCLSVRTRNSKNYCSDLLYFFPKKYYSLGLVLL